MAFPRPPLPPSNNLISQDQEYPKSFNIENKLPNIIFMIGDGMGLTQITAGLYQNNNSLNLEGFNNIGLVTDAGGPKLDGSDP